MNKELKPCPFCGGGAELNNSGGSEGKEWVISCQKCSMGLSGSNKESVVKQWETRISHE